MELGSLRRKPGFCTIISSYCPALLTATGPIASTDEQSTDSRNAPPATRSVLDLHQTVLRDLNPDWAGRLRNAQVFIKGTRHTPPNAAHVSDELDALVAQIGQCALHPVLQAAETHCRFESLHPFFDGNGRKIRRVSRMRSGIRWLR